MNYLPTAFLKHLRGQSTTITDLVRITRKDGFKIGFSSHDQDIVFEGLVYKANSAMTPKAVEKSSDMSVDNTGMDAHFTSDGLTEQDLFSGKYDGAVAEVIRLNYEQPEAGHKIMESGFIGQVKASDGKFSADILSLFEKLQQSKPRRAASTCPEYFGSPACGMNREAFAVDTVITQIIDDTNFVVDPVGWLTNDRYADLGLIVCKSGSNNAAQNEVHTHLANGSIRLFAPYPFPLNVGDAVRIYQGCSGAFSMCRDKFNNARRFRGFLFVPGQDSVGARMPITAG